MKLQFTTCLIFMTAVLLGQPTVKVEVSADTISPGEFVEVTYTIENGEGRFEAPDMSNLTVVSGPNTSSSFMIQNGTKSSSLSYSYILQAQEEGKMIIPRTSFHEKGQDLKIDPVEIVVSRSGNKSISSQPDSNSLKAKREKKKF